MADKGDVIASEPLQVTDNAKQNGESISFKEKNSFFFSQIKHCLCNI